MSDSSPSQATSKPPQKSRVRVLIFAKAPQLGQVKTRLAKGIGASLALELYKAFVLKTLEAVEASGLQATLVMTPAERLGAFQQWLSPLFKGLPLDWRVQSEGDLGQRLQTAFLDAMASHPNPSLLVIGTDCPDLTATTLAHAEEALATHEAVLGPSLDGGYTLLGLSPEGLATLRAKHFPIFQAMPWSTDQVAQLTLEKLEACRLSVAQLPALQDIDTLEDLEANPKALALYKQVRQEAEEAAS